MDSKVVDHEGFLRAVEETERRFPNHAALVFFNIDDVAHLVSAYGHEVVDRIAADLADLVRTALPECTVSLYGVDVAAVFVGGADEHDPEVVVPRVIDTIYATPLSLHGAPVQTPVGWHIHADAATTGVIHLSVKAGLIIRSRESLVPWVTERPCDDGTVAGAAGYYVTRHYDEYGRLGRRSVRVTFSDLTMPERITAGPFR